MLTGKYAYAMIFHMSDASRELDGAPTLQPRPFLRQVRRERVRSVRLQAVDLAWFIGLASLAASLCGVFEVVHHPVLRWIVALPNLTPWSQVAGVASVCVLSLEAYLAGLLLRDRYTAVVCGLLVATSGMLTGWSTSDPLILVFALLVFSTLLAFLFNQSIACAVLACAAASVRADAFVLGLILCVASIFQNQRYSRIALPCYLILIALLVGASIYALGIQPARLLPDRFPQHFWISSWMVAPPVWPVLWFAVPFLAELASPLGRRRYVPLLAWLACALLAQTFRPYASYADALIPLLPFLYLIIGVGFGRLMPAVAGDVHRPIIRYMLGALALVVILAFRVRIEWPMLLQHCAKLATSHELTFHMQFITQFMRQLVVGVSTNMGKLPALGWVSCTFANIMR